MLKKLILLTKLMNKRPVFKLPLEFGNEIPKHFVRLLNDMKKYSDFEGEAIYRFTLNNDGSVYFTPELKGKHKKSLYFGISEMFGELCRDTIKHIQK